MIDLYCGAMQCVDSQVLALVVHQCDPLSGLVRLPLDDLVRAVKEHAALRHVVLITVTLVTVHQTCGVSTRGQLSCTHGGTLA